ncbi:1948_t:CDS:1, partial [Paraglomus brasilianum]
GTLKDCQVAIGGYAEGCASAGKISDCSVDVTNPAIVMTARRPRILTITKDSLNVCLPELAPQWPD